jgi:hypothetical protein
MPWAYLTWCISGTHVLVLSYLAIGIWVYQVKSSIEIKKTVYVSKEHDLHCII